MADKLRIYTLEGLTPEVKAVTFAKCSRSPEPFDKIAKELTEEKSSEFHEKWVVGYGHSSVAEHAVLSIAIENITTLGCKILEDNRLSSYTEKSSRYQIFDKSKYYTPPKIQKSKHAQKYKQNIDFIFDTYTRLAEPMAEFVNKKYPRDPKTSAGLYKSISKAKLCDNIRYLLPLCAYRNLGWTVNARILEMAICKFLSHPLEEMNEVGKTIKEVGQKITPTLIKYANHSEYLNKTRQEFEELAKEKNQELGQPADSPAVTIVNFEEDNENKLVTALLYKHLNHPYEQVYQKVQSMSQTEKKDIIDLAVKHRGDHDQPIRELEHIYYTFDIFMDYSAWYDLQRHRICTQTTQLETTRLGYNTPAEIIEAGFAKDYHQALEKSVELYELLAEDMPHEAQYACTMATNHRTLYTFNLRELHHLISLRSSPRGHWSYRRIAQLCWEELNKIHPLLAKYIRVTMESTGNHA